MKPSGVPVYIDTDGVTWNTDINSNGIAFTFAELEDLKDEYFYVARSEDCEGLGPKYETREDYEKSKEKNHD